MEKITAAHGSGGKMTGELIRGIFEKHFNNDVLSRMEDSASLDISSSRIAFTTDSFVITPPFFKGGDIGKLAVCGTVNDLLTAGAVPKYISAAFIIEQGFSTSKLDIIAGSMAAAAKEAGVTIVTGDTKVVEGSGSNLYINTAGIGELYGKSICAANVKAGDAVILSGTLGDHHACIMSERMGIENEIATDCAPLVDMVTRLLAGNIDVHCMRDVTRGGLATVLNEIADASGTCIEIETDEGLCVSAVQSFCDILGLDPLYMANEGKMLFVLPANQAQEAVNIIRASRYGENAKLIAQAEDGKGVFVRTKAGGKRKMDVLTGESLPRIC